MGSEQSNNNNKPTPQMTEAKVKRLLAAQKEEYDKKIQEMLAKAAAQNTAQTASVERERAPYQFTRDDLQHAIRESTAPRHLYPNLHEAAAAPCSSSNVHSFSFQDTNPYRQPQNQGFVYVNNNGQTQGFRPAPCPSAPSAPSAPPTAVPRSRPVSRNRRYGRNTSPSRERDVLDCPSCNSRYGLKIFQCNNGHSSCSDCKTRNRPCGFCRQSITERRNFDLERHVSQMKAACPNTSEGCKLFIKIADMETHAKECPFKEQECPLALVFGNCHWKGKLNQISNHFDCMHSTNRQTNVDTEMHLMNISNTSQQVHLVVLGVYNFLFHLKVSELDRNIYMTVQLIGTKMSATKWLYEIHVYNKAEKLRKYSFTDHCNSSSQSVNDIFQEKNCAVLPTSYAATFVNNGALTYKIFIKKTNEGKSNFGNNQRGGRDDLEVEEDKSKKSEFRDNRESVNSCLNKSEEKDSRQEVTSRKPVRSYLNESVNSNLNESQESDMHSDGIGRESNSCLNESEESNTQLNGTIREPVRSCLNIPKESDNQRNGTIRKPVRSCLNIPKESDNQRNGTIREPVLSCLNVAKESDTQLNGTLRELIRSCLNVAEESDTQLNGTIREPVDSCLNVTEESETQRNSALREPVRSCLNQSKEFYTEWDGNTHIWVNSTLKQSKKNFTEWEWDGMTHTWVNSSYT